MILYMKRTNKKHNFLQKLFWNYSAAVLGILFFLFAVLMLIIYTSQYQKNLDTQQQLVQKTEEQIDASLQSMDRIINGLIFNKTFKEIMRDETAPLHYTDYNKQVLNIFVSLDAPLFTTHRIIAFTRDVYYTFTKTGDNPDLLKDAITTYPWRDVVLGSNGEKQILPVHQDPFAAEETLVYSVARSGLDGRHSFGIVEVQNSYDQLKSFCAIDARLGSMYLFSPQGELIYPYQDRETAENPFYADLFRAVRKAGTHAGSLNFEHQQVSFTVSEYSGWVTVMACPTSSLFPSLFNMFIVALAAFALLMAVSLFTIRKLTQRMTAPLVELSNALSQVSLENLSLSLTQSYDIVEIENINHSFQVMFQQLKEAIAKSVQARANEERANYLALQSQMNPHTIYNTIGMIESVSYMNGDKEVSNLCICFSQMLRYLSDYSKRQYTLQDEIQYLYNYAVLIEKRYEGKLKIEIDAADELLSKVLPKFTIQPLVENAVKHGLHPDIPVLNIRVTARRVAGGWCVLVKDNGKGFTNEKLEAIFRQFAHCDECLRANNDVVSGKIGNLALSNLYIRCRIQYGGAFQFNIYNDPAQGGCVELIFLAEEPEHD